ncbi:DNA-binding MarR family transcriptional regulator [Nocardia tenerifensis]|uniref:DNA-binding MarR family transcriptional regulator n=1 Tax=Nocardia tenerifensis TaxID=228006 RepID=A0A318KFJ5_9NOCA|nr:MarR family transcriptional regulator [Nocardia tenerifensis]PXX71735.1 DNA-binding MarR family transcriptional regulator [Nocardia tenerifensis]
MTTDDPGLAAAFAGLNREVNALYHLIARRFGLTMQQAELLCQLHGDPPSFGELASALGCDKTNVTGMVDRLERRGFLARQTDPADRRVTRIVITEEGQGMRSEIRAAFERELSMRLPAADRARLVAHVHASATALADNRTGTPTAPVRPTH